MKKSGIIVILILLIAIPSFAHKTPFPPPDSPYQTVNDYVFALKEKNFNRAYQYITKRFAGNLTEENWVFWMSLADETSGWELLEFKILKVNVAEDIALVISRGSMETIEGQMLMIGNYLLKKKKSEWKIDGKDIRELITIPENEDESDIYGQGDK